MSESSQLEFARIDRDLSYLMDTFSQVLEDTGDAVVARALPWRADTVHAPVTENDTVQAYSISFQLLNMVEENTVNQMRRYSERQHGLLEEASLWGYCLGQLSKAGWSPEDIAACLPHLRVEPVLTAHPTESKRISVLEQHRLIYLNLVQRDNTMWTPSERKEIDRQVATTLERLWRTGETLLEKPTVDAERAAMLHYFGNVFPEALRMADTHLRAAWEAAGFDPALIADPASLPRLRFGTWVGGDRDGHPLVTPAVTRETLAELRHMALSLQIHKLEEARARLSLSSILQPVPPSLVHKIDTLGSLVGEKVFKHIRERNPNEPWRQVLSLLLERMPAITSPLARTSGEPLSEKTYRFAHQLTQDLRDIRDSLCEIGAERIAQTDIDPVIRSVEVFGFHLAALDIRQNSGLHEIAISQILAEAGWKDTDFSAWPEEKRIAFLVEQLERSSPLVNPLTLTGKEALTAVGALREFAIQRDNFGDEGIGTIILSMTRSFSDLLGVYFLAREAGLMVETDEGSICSVPVAPLLETIDDLEAGPGILEAFLDTPLTKRSLAWFRRKYGKVNRKRRNLPEENLPIDTHAYYQQVMIGYSDSNKDSGILAAQWALNSAQKAIARLAAEHSVRIRFFHGRGGTVSRGAGPTHRFLEALPGGSAGLDIRLTEQGEVIAQKYATLLTASYNLDLLLAGTFYFSLVHRTPEDTAHPLEGLMSQLADSSRRVYRQLLELPEFMDFYRQATPIDALENSRIGSRPSRRTGARTLNDLRAIPWVFSWSQSRFFLPGWFGVGSALEKVENEDPAAWQALRQAMDSWPFLRYVLTNVETALLSSDPALMKAYATLVEDPSVRDTVLMVILEEHERAMRTVSTLLAGPDRQRRPRLEKTIALRAEALHPLHLRQIDLLRQWRRCQDPAQKEGLLQDLLLTVNAIASGLRTTG